MARSGGSVADAVQGVKRAQDELDAAKTALEHARNILDGKLAERGWRRLAGAFSPDSTVLYESDLYPGAALNLGQVLAHLEQLAVVAS